MLEQLPNLASDNLTHSYQSCPLVESFSEDRGFNGCSTSFAESPIGDCLELNFKHVDYQSIAYLYCAH